MKNETKKKMTDKEKQDWNELCDYVKFITPVPNGVGLITTCELMNNIYKSYLLRNKNV